MQAEPHPKPAGGLHGEESEVLNNHHRGMEHDLGLVLGERSDSERHGNDSSDTGSDRME